MIQIFITNLGRYVEGCLDGKFLAFPATTEELTALLRGIHVDGIRYEEIFMTDYDTDIPGLSACLGEYESLDELNYLASLLDSMQEHEIAVFSAAIEHGEHTGSVRELINLAYNLDCYEFFPDISSEEDLGRYYIEELSALEVPEHLLSYIDYEAYGRDIALDENSSFVAGGYIVSAAGFTEYYNGEDIPEEYCIFSQNQRGENKT